MSSKVLADVTEALIGAVYLDCRIGKAEIYMRCLIPQIRSLSSMVGTAWCPFTETTLVPASRIS